MLCHNSNIVLQCIFFNSIMHNDIRIKASKVSNFNEPRKSLFDRILFRNAIVEEMMSCCCCLQGFTRSSQLVYHSLMPHKMTMSHTMTCSHIHASKFVQSQATQLYLHLFQTPSNQLMINVFNHCFDIVI